MLEKGLRRHVLFLTSRYSAHEKVFGRKDDVDPVLQKRMTLDYPMMRRLFRLFRAFGINFNSLEMEKYGIF